jgi:hypothetical protein
VRVTQGDPFPHESLRKNYNASLTVFWEKAEIVSHSRVRLARLDLPRSGMVQ